MSIEIKSGILSDFFYQQKKLLEKLMQEKGSLKKIQYGLPLKILRFCSNQKEQT